MKNPLLAVVIVGCSGSAAIAGSPSVYPQAAPQPYIEYVHPTPARPDTQWTGFYAGGLGGVQVGNVTPGDVDLGAVSAGGFAGYNFQKDQIVMGVEVAAQTGTFYTPDESSLDYVVDAKARLGYSFGDALVFASGGYSATAADIEGADANGWIAGAGLDYAITDRIFVGGEYTYRSLPNTSPDGFEYQSHGGQLRVGLQF